ncbi:EAL domain-containing protein [Nitrosomonas marina]|uniref:EAL domain-containing protein n=1 Tax=Nitrosomonas marina TaxID=917 RepID=UPI0015A7250F|nr:EAL domain-containing protein [Nitrosomonas marina]
MRSKDLNRANTNSSSNNNVRLVGIGASAGGLEALRDLMESLPESNCLSYVIAQHVSPTHVSMLINLLSPLTHLTVQDLKDQQLPEPKNVYITPPNNDVILDKGLFRLVKPQHSIGPKPSVNRFFFSLADELKEHAIGIILSGTGSDGASGIKAIKEAGGITIAQNPETAKYDGMPKAALHTGSVDLTLTSSDIGKVLPRLLDHPTDFTELLTTTEHKTDEYGQIYNLVRNYTAFKLDAYKSATIQRRIARRMSILGIHSLSDYAKYLRANKEEAHLLIRDTFISVTYFFRDKEAFAALELIIDKIVNSQANHNIIRCWIPGCASGEEVYSIAMLFEESILKQQRADLQYMIFASDLDDAAVERARVALYPISELETVPKPLLDAYTEKAGDHRRILKSIRNRIVFTRQNVIEDPPFGRMDLISCRNLLIYLTPEAQKKVLQVFHYALNKDGYLFLGKSENLDLHKDLFQTVNGKAHIYMPSGGAVHYSLPISQEVPTVSVEKNKSLINVATSTDYITMRTLEELAQCYAPPSLVIDESNSIVHFEGNLKSFLNFPKGRAEMYLFDMIPSSLRTELRALVYRCRRKSEPAEGSIRTVEIYDKPYPVKLVVRPLEHGKESLLLVSFITINEQQNEKPNPGTETLAEAERDSLIINELEKELTNTRTHLNIVVEELETSNEELQSLNEEMQSANEELQSTNEELQTSNEELQSTNEELLTVNEELQVKTAELEKTSSDLVNVKQSLDFPLIVVDRQLRITQTNNACSEVAALDSVMENSSLNSVQWLIEIPGLYNQVHKVIRENARFENKITHPETDKVFELYVMPYCDSQNEIAGAILLFNNISAQHTAEAAFHESEVKFSQAMQHAPIGICLQSTEGQFMDVNPALCEILGYPREELLRRDVYSVTHSDDLQATLSYVDEMLSGKIDSHYLEKRFIHKKGNIIWTTLHKATIKDYAGAPKYFIALIQDISERKKYEEELRLAANVFSNALDGIIITDDKAIIIKVNKAFENILGYKSEDVVGQHTRILRSHRHDDDFYRAMWQKIHKEGFWHGEIWDRHKDGHIVPVWLSISALKDPAGKTDHYIAVMYDISEQKHYHERINHLAHYDALTQLPNRALFTERLKHALAQAKRSQTKLALLFIDLDHFKQINDTHGHHIGDELLCKVADKLTSIMRATDTVSRLSGDEFTVLIEDNVNEDKARMVAEKILKAMESPFELHSGAIYISASIGITLYPDDGDDIESLLKQADLAMYRSKEAGRNHFHFYTHEMSKRVQERMRLSTDLRETLQKNQLQLYYQPIIDFGSGDYVGAEALLRWKHVDLDWIPPDKFVSVAEDNDLIFTLGEWVLQQAFQQMNAWTEANLNPGILSVNVSGKQLVSNNFLATIDKALSTTKCSPETVTLEITESVIMKESDGASSTLNRLRDLGFGIAIDDFGTGYSSLSYLKRLPVTKLKLDKSFVQDLPDDTNDVAIARAILSMGKSLGLEVIAEGVESSEQHDFLQMEKCKFGQGYYYAKPMPAEKFKKHLMKLSAGT